MSALKTIYNEQGHLVLSNVLWALSDFDICDSGWVIYGYQGPWYSFLKHFLPCHFSPTVVESPGCQLDCVWNWLRDSFLGIAESHFLDQVIWNGSPALNVGGTFHGTRRNKTRLLSAFLSHWWIHSRVAGATAARLYSFPAIRTFLPWAP